jgi:hypothetical protein
MLHCRGEKSFLMKVTMRDDEVTRPAGNFVRPTIKNFQGPRSFQELTGRRFLHEKTRSIPKQFSEKKIVLCPNPDEVT